MTNEARDYMQAVYTVAEGHFNMLFCNNLAHFGGILDVIEAKPEQIISDIREGHFSVELKEKDREFLEESFGKHEKRAAELEQILAEDGRLTYEKIWPEFCFIGAWLGGSIGRMSEDVLRRLPKQIKMYFRNVRQQRGDDEHSDGVRRTVRRFGDLWHLCRISAFKRR